LLLTALPPNGDANPSLLAALEHQAQSLLAASRQGHPDVLVLVRSHGLTESVAATDATSISLETARELVAREHGYPSFAEAATQGASVVDARFEFAADAVVTGDLEALQELLRLAPGLARSRSSYPHHATLLHVSAANGIEHTRQWQSPANAAVVARALIGAGAAADATCDVYRGGSGTTPLVLLVSSGPPAVAGVQAALVEVLCAGGANPNGLDEDGLPLWTAITFGYSAAVERLAAFGARIDNVVFAAALGDLARVEWYVKQGQGQSSLATSRSAWRIGARGPELEPQYMLEYALIYACRHSRREVVEFLLSQDLDLSVKEPLWKSSALGMARHARELSGRLEENCAIIELLETALRTTTGGR
jgi:hypothetical protein